MAARAFAQRVGDAGTDQIIRAALPDSVTLSNPRPDPGGLFYVNLPGAIYRLTYSHSADACLVITPRDEDLHYDEKKRAISEANLISRDADFSVYLIAPDTDRLPQKNAAFQSFRQSLTQQLQHNANGTPLKTSIPVHPPKHPPGIIARQPDLIVPPAATNGFGKIISAALPRNAIFMPDRNLLNFYPGESTPGYVSFIYRIYIEFPEAFPLNVGVIVTGADFQYPTETAATQYAPMLIGGDEHRWVFFKVHGRLEIDDAEIAAWQTTRANLKEAFEKRK